MARRKKVKLENTVSASVPLSSMIDVVFLLLIYFIMTQKKVVEDVYLMTDLPAPTMDNASNAQNMEKSIIEVNLSDAKEVDGKIENEKGKDTDWFWEKKILEAKTQDEVDAYKKEIKIYYSLRKGNDRRYLTRDELKEWLVNLRKMNPDALVLIKCDSNARHKKLIEVLDLCTELQLDNISLLHSNDSPFRPMTLKESQEKYGIRPGEPSAN